MSRLRLIIMGHLAYQPPLIYLNQLNEQVLTYLQKWDQGAEDHQELSKAERAKCLVNDKKYAKWPFHDFLGLLYHHCILTAI